MKIVLTLLLIVGCINIEQVKSQAGENIYINLRFSEPEFMNMKTSAGDGAISDSELGRWMGISGNVMAQWPEDRGERFVGQVSVYLINSRGMIQSQSTIQGNHFEERPVSLAQFTNGAFSRIIQGDMDFEEYGAVDMFIPQMNYIRSEAEAGRMATDIARRAIRSSGSDHALVVIIIPSGSRYDVPVRPGGAVFTGTFE